MPTKITALPSGPYIIEGECELFDPTGARVDTTGMAKLALCRCGQSGKRPFCDGTHRKVAFKADEPSSK